MKFSGHVVRVAALVAVSTVVLFFVLRLVFPIPTQASAEATTIDTLFNAHFIMISLLFSLIMVIMLYAAFVFRRQEGDDSPGRYMHGNTALEIGWTVVPTIIVVGFGVWGAVALNDITSPNTGEMTINVTARQWSWSFEYPEDGDVVSAELLLPVNQPVVLAMESEDVLHSFWVPEFRVKQDILPGRKTNLRFTPTRQGDYKVRCAEICGLDHSLMLAPVRVVSDEAFLAWIEEKSAVPVYAELSPAERGEIWASPDGGFACAGCHSVDGTALAGPTWLELYGSQEQLVSGDTVTVDDSYIRESILEPNAQIVSGFNPNIMPPTYEEQFAEREAEILTTQGAEIDIIADLIAYMATLD